MKSIVTTLLLFISFVSNAGDIPKFGNISRAELEMTSCEFEPDAVAMYLYHSSEVYYFENRTADIRWLYDIHSLYNTTIQEVKVRIKLFSDKAGAYSNIRIKYDTDEEEMVDNIEGSTYNLVNGKQVETPLRKESIFTEDGIDGEKTKIFAMPEIKKGSVIEYRYTLKRFYKTVLPSWQFQHQIPIAISRHSILVPQQFQIKTRFLTTEPIDKKINEGSGSTEYMYTMRNLQGLKKEEYMSSFYDYLQSIYFTMTQFTTESKHNLYIGNSWEDVVKTIKSGYLAPYFYEQINQTIPVDNAYTEKVSSIKTDREKMIFIYKYVRDYMTWNLKTSFLTRHGIRRAWNKRSGSNGEINMILISLLKHEGLDVEPILGSTHPNGSINQFFPTFYQFNTVITMVKAGNETFFLDASSKKQPFSFISPEIFNTTGLLIKSKSFEWVNISTENFESKNSVSMMGEINEQGMLSGDLQINSTNYARLKQEQQWSQGKEKYTEAFSHNKNGLTLNNLEVENSKEDSLPFIQIMKFSQKLQTTESYSFFNLNFLPDFDENPFLSDNRYTDIDFDSKQKYMLRGSITLPALYKIESIPPDLALIMPDTSIEAHRMIHEDNGVLSFKIEITFHKSNFPQDEYPVLKDYYKKLYAMLNDKILLKK